MLQSLKNFSWILLLAVGQQTLWAYSLLGPVANGGDAWQVEAIGYNPIPDNTGAPPFFIDPLAVGPKNLGEEYRRNTPVMYFACDANFLNYFGSSGSAAIDDAFNVLNNSLTNVDGFSSALTEYPLNTESVNYQASALNLLDLKSETMQLMMEQLGLADPIRYAWCLHNRFQPPGTTCPVETTYQVVQRNFDITASPLNQLQYSPYINGSLYTYVIYEICSDPAAPPNADTIPILVDPLVNNPPVASIKSAGLEFEPGMYYTGLTRDDMAGLRYLLSTNNILYESPTPGSVLLSSTVSGGVNYGPPFVLYTSNYTAFAEAALTNDPVTLSNLFPGLIITSSTAHFAYLPTTTYVAYYTNYIGAPAGSQTLVVVPVTTYSVVTTYSYTFANLVASTNSGGSVGLLYTVTVGPQQGAPAGSPYATNTTVSYISQPGVPTGDYYINTNACGTNLIISTLASIPVYTTNVIYSATNALGQSALQYIVTASTIHIYIAEAPICGNSGGGTTTNAPGLYQGIGHMRFVKTSYDSLLGQFYQPITNTYTEVVVNGHQSSLQTFQRVVTTPDVLFTAADLLPGPAAGNTYVVPYDRTINFDQSNIGNGLAGPGVINPASTITYDKVGPVLNNVGLGNIGVNGGQASATELNFYVWGSFDGSTNDPVVYPNGASTANLENQVLILLNLTNSTSGTMTSFPAGTNGVPYATTSIVASGGPVVPPFTWSVAQGPVVSGNLPPGLTLSSGGKISGTPTQSGIFDFTIELTDSLSNTVTWDYSITIN
jgi:hypothetical protein